MELEIKLDKHDRCFGPSDTVSGVVIVRASSASSHAGIKLLVEGTVNLQLSARSVGLFEAFYSSIKPMELVNYEIEICPAGRVPKGETEFPFEYPLRPRKNMKLHETYHGVYINVQYTITVEMFRSMLAKNIKRSIEFIVKSSPVDFEKKQVNFTITPENLKNVQRQQTTNVPNFGIRGHFDSGVCNVEEPFTGEIVVEQSDQQIKSIELQFVRVETCAYAEAEIREATEVQNIQLADGDVCRNLAIPIYMIFPRLFTCVTTITKSFKIEFEVNVVLLFRDSHMLTENFPITLVRKPTDHNF